METGSFLFDFTSTHNEPRPDWWGCPQATQEIERELPKPEKRKYVKRDYVGHRFPGSKLVVIKLDHIGKASHKHYLCVCDCGETKVIDVENLKSGMTKSCGCLIKKETK